MIFLMMIGLLAQSQSLFPEIGKVIGEDNFISVNKEASNIPSLFKNHPEAIGWTNYGCTVTHIGNGIALTAGHCFEAKTQVEYNKKCPYAEVEWGYREGKKPTLTSECEIILAMQNSPTSDFAILKMSTYPKEFVEIDLETELQINDQLTLFSHPDRQPLQWSQYCLLEFPRGGQIPVEKMNYTCDTSGGSSGAAVLSAFTGKIVGLHNGGYPKMNYGTYLNSGKLRELLLDLTQN